ncbi:transcriptional regulator, TetR family [Alkalibacterium putridalgicola]|uniref:TetR family transcriptional regulator n=1 Tax=Alkalibacterium putridalgicola TaxID=426703 RepID=A0A1H7VIZ9_9LACT|nr:TetR family transcriptional regulator [Alkalibacterium putridalgicola]GEK89395.1 TetR family transcriptional regulator [Alkalibacterium putridalgicola]SEM09251.1 transcriptional regulator, TetR family [Alkalibacterium putridalgicola]
MMETKTDPRVLRTRKLITDAFIKLSQSKSFSDISVKDITEEAMINRATFYNHFLDKYDLLEKVVEEKLHLNLGCDKQKTTLTIEETIKTVFLSLTRFKTSVSTISGQEEQETIDTIIKLELVNIFSRKLSEIDVSLNASLKLKLARWLTATVRSTSQDWVESDNAEEPEEYIASLIPFIMCGIETL